MKKERPEMMKEAEIVTSTSDTENLAEAVKIVYRRYGTNLSAFFQDAYKYAARKQEARLKDKTEAYQP